MSTIFEPAHSSQVKSWLTKELEPICDAEPDVLADYVIALLKHDATEADLSSLLNEQLTDFLDDKTSPFVSKLVGALSSRSYLPPEQRPAPEAEAGPSSRKRAAEDDDLSSVPAKNPRANDSAGLPQAPRGPASGRNGEIRERPKRDAPQGKTKDLCRDFHQKGWCSRGESCRFEHSTDAITGGMPNSMSGGFPGPQAHMLPQGQFNGPRNPVGLGAGGFMGRPPAPNMPFPMPYPQPNWNGPMGPSQGMPGVMPHFAGSPPPHGLASPPGPSPQESMGSNTGSSLAMRLGEQQQQHQQPQAPAPPFALSAAHQSDFGGAQRGGFGNGRGRGRGGAMGGLGQFQSRARSTTTLVIENVPTESLELMKINDYFRKFGTITNIQIDQANSKALVSYAAPAEAKAAHESPDVIFGNRFVKVYFQKVDESQGGDSRPPAPRPPPVQKPTFGAGQNVYRAPTAASPSNGSDVGQTGTATPPAIAEKAAERKEALAVQKRAQDKVNELMTEQKQLLLKVSGPGASADAKKEGMAKLRALEPLIKTATEEVRAAVTALAALPSMGPRNATGAASAGPIDPTKRYEQKEKMERDRLDRELDAHSSAPTATAGGSGQTAELRAKLEALKAEAASLGLESSGASSGHNSRGGFHQRGRGSRGASSFRGGRGALGNGAGSMRLDNRSTKLTVSDVPEGKDAQKVKEWLKSFGDVASFDDEIEGSGSNRNFAVTFKQRHAGESAVRSLAQPDYEIPDVGRVKLVWAPASASAIGAPSSSHSSTGGERSSHANDGADGAGGSDAAAGHEGGEGEDDNWKR